MKVQVSKKKNKYGHTSKSYFIYLPMAICKSMGIREGDEIELDLKTIPGKILLSL